MPRKSTPLHLEPGHKEDIKPGPGFISRIQNLNSTIKKKNQQKTRRDTAQRRRDSMLPEKVQQKLHDDQKKPTLSEDTSMVPSDWRQTQVNNLWSFPMLQTSYTMDPMAIDGNIPSQESFLEDDFQYQSYNSSIGSDVYPNLWSPAPPPFPDSSVFLGSELYTDPWSQSSPFENINSYEGSLVTSQPWDYAFLPPLGADYDPKLSVGYMCSDRREDPDQVGLETDLRKQD